MTVLEIHAVLRRIGGFYGVYVPEFTYGGRRIDAAIIDVSQAEIAARRRDEPRPAVRDNNHEYCA